MQKLIFLLYAMISLIWAATGLAEQKFEKDSIKTVKRGAMEITFIGHGTVMIIHGKTVVHIDPWSRMADYSKLPRADIIVLTHDHPDHLDLSAIETLRKPTTQLIMPKVCADKVKEGIVMKNGDTKTVANIAFEAVPAYNIVHMRSENMPFHPKGVGNGYVMTFGGKRVYVAGDTENIPEMKALKNIDVAFLPMNLPYTMTPEMVADAAKAFKPKVLYPYHYGDTDVNRLVTLLKNESIDVRIRKMK